MFLESGILFLSLFSRCDLTNMHEDNGGIECNISDLWETVVRRREILDLCADKGWLISTGEIARIIGLKPVAITNRGASFEHETWVFRQIKRQGNNYVWSVKKVDIEI